MPHAVRLTPILQHTRGFQVLPVPEGETTTTAAAATAVDSLLQYYRKLSAPQLPADKRAVACRAFEERGKALITILAGQAGSYAANLQHRINDLLNNIAVPPTHPRTKVPPPPGNVAVHGRGREQEVQHEQQVPDVLLHRPLRLPVPDLLQHRQAAGDVPGDDGDASPKVSVAAVRENIAEQAPLDGVNVSVGDPSPPSGALLGAPHESSLTDQAMAPPSSGDVQPSPRQLQRIRQGDSLERVVKFARTCASRELNTFECDMPLCSMLVKPVGESIDSAKAKGRSARSYGDSRCIVP
eukprot:gene23831-biopygen62085